jgi:hypothetical protein
MWNSGYVHAASLNLNPYLMTSSRSCSLQIPRGCILLKILARNKYCIAGNRKTALLSSLLTKQWYGKMCSYWKPCKLLRSSWEVWNPAGIAESIHLQPPPPPHTHTFDLSDMWKGIPSAEEQFLSTQCCCHWVLWHTGSHCIIIVFIISNFIFLLLLILRKSKLNLF